MSPSHLWSSWIAQLTFEPLGKDHGIPLAVMGILVVFAALVLVVVFITLLPRMMAVLDRWHPEAREQPLRAAAPKKEHGLAEETIVVIAAAVAEAISEPHHIVHTREVRPDQRGWSLEGRTQHHRSHRLPRRDHH